MIGWPVRKPLNVLIARSRWALIAARSLVSIDGNSWLQIAVVWRSGLERKTKLGRLGFPWDPRFVESDDELLKLGLKGSDGHLLTIPDVIKPQHRRIPWRQRASTLLIPLPDAGIDPLTFVCEWKIAGIRFKVAPLQPSSKSRRGAVAVRSKLSDLEPGAVLPLDRLVASTDRADVWLVTLVAESGGFALGIHRQVKDASGMDLHVLPVQYLERGPTDDVFRYGIEYSSGARATNLDEQCRIRRRSAKLDVISREYAEDSAIELAWCTPVPAAGHVSFVCEWPAAGIGLTRHTLDGDKVRATAARSASMAS